MKSFALLRGPNPVECPWEFARGVALNPVFDSPRPIHTLYLLDAAWGVATTGNAFGELSPTRYCSVERIDRVAMTPYTLCLGKNQRRPLVWTKELPSQSSNTMLQLRIHIKAVLFDYKSTPLTPQTFLLHEISIKSLQSCRQPNRQL